MYSSLLSRNRGNSTRSLVCISRNSLAAISSPLFSLSNFATWFALRSFFSWSFLTRLYEQRQALTNSSRRAITPATRPNSSSNFFSGSTKVFCTSTISSWTVLPTWLVIEWYSSTIWRNSSFMCARPQVLRFVLRRWSARSKFTIAST